jgi:hypothetical protein
VSLETNARSRYSNPARRCPIAVRRISFAVRRIRLGGRSRHRHERLQQATRYPVGRRRRLCDLGEPQARGVSGAAFFTVVRGQGSIPLLRRST